MALTRNLGCGPAELGRVHRLVEASPESVVGNGVNASQPNPGERVRDVHLAEDTLPVDLSDGRTIIVPLIWYPTRGLYSF